MSDDEMRAMLAGAQYREREALAEVAMLRAQLDDARAASADLRQDLATRDRWLTRATADLRIAEAHLHGVEAAVGQRHHDPGRAVQTVERLAGEVRMLRAPGGAGDLAGLAARGGA